jgi:hypothetical protein
VGDASPSSSLAGLIAGSLVGGLLVAAAGAGAVLFFRRRPPPPRPSRHFLDYSPDEETVATTLYATVAMESDATLPDGVRGDAFVTFTSDCPGIHII